MGIRTLIVDDHGVLRAGLRALLASEADLEVVGEAADGDEALRMAGELSPEVVLMDITMPGMDGIEATRKLLAEMPSARVLLLTVHADSSLLREALQAGAAGYILKRAVESELINAIRAVARGDLYIDPAMTRALLTEPARNPCRDNLNETLTSRETEVLQLIAGGYTNRQIAEKLTISVRTVEGHRANIMGKLDLRSRVELVRYARETGLID
ncbi:MAG TPA: response regulator transcription factor [Anaerolineales bacterium]